MLKKLILCLMALQHTPYALSMDAQDLSLSTQKLVKATLNNDPVAAIHALNEGANAHALIAEKGFMRGITVMHMAVVDSKIAMVKILLDKKVPIDIRDVNGLTPLMQLVAGIDCTYKSFKKQMEIFNFLIEQKADVNACGFSGPAVNALMLACATLNPEIARVLLGAGALVCCEQDTRSINEILYVIMTTSKEKFRLSSDKILNKSLDLIELLRCGQSQVNYGRGDTDDTSLHLAVNKPYIVSSLLVPLTASSLQNNAHFKKRDEKLHNVAVHHAIILKKLGFNRIFTFLCCLNRIKKNTGIIVQKDIKSLILTKYLPVEFTYADFNTGAYKGIFPTIGSKNEMRLRFLNSCLPRLHELANVDPKKNMHKQMITFLQAKNTSGQTPFDCALEEYKKAQAEAVDFNVELLHVLNPHTWMH